MFFRIFIMEYKFKYTDLVMFHKIYHGNSVVKLPQWPIYCSYHYRNRLRSNIIPPERYSGQSTSDMPDLASRRMNRFDSTSIKCAVDDKTNCFRHSFFFRRHTDGTIYQLKLGSSVVMIFKLVSKNICGKL